MNDIEIRKFRDVISSLSDKDFFGDKKELGLYNIVCKSRSQRLMKQYINERISKK